VFITHYALRFTHHVSRFTQGRFTMTRKLILIVLIVSCCIGCDQVTKEIAKDTLQGAAPRSWGYDTVRLHYVKNAGAFLSLGATLSDRLRFWIFVVLPGCFLSGLLIFELLTSTLGLKEQLALALLAGGGISNLIDRVVQNGYVTDFLNIGIGPLRTGIFNIADVLILCGAAGLIFSHLFPNQSHKSFQE
jgi:signal peptidase II